MKDATLSQASKILSLFDETPREQIQAILGSGLLADLRDGNIVEVNRDEFRKIIGLEPLKPKLLLEFVGTVKIPATSGKFVAKDKFIQDTSRKAKVKISYIGDNFNEWLLGKVEDAVAETELRYAKLLKISRGERIRAEIGAQFEETSLSYMYALMEMQANGEKGALLISGWANVFYIRDISGALRAVDVHWGSDGWGVGAGPVDDPGRWGDGFQFFFCDSCITL